MTNSPGHRAAAYWFSDGLPEICWGLSLAFLGGSTALGVLYRAEWWSQALLAVAALNYLTFLWKERKFLGFLKQRLTYPRTGYADAPVDGYPPDEFPITLHQTRALNKKENVTSFRLATAQLVILMPGFLEVFTAPRAVVALMFVVAGLIYWSSRQSEHRYSLWSVLLLALTGVPLGVLDVPLHARESLAIMAGGLWLSLHGIFILARYLHANPHLPAADLQKGARA